jgi:hypothetical protein
MILIGLSQPAMLEDLAEELPIFLIFWSDIFGWD